MKKIKVCHVITRMIIGGAQENTLLTVEGLAQKRAYDVTLVTGSQKGPEGDLTYQIDAHASYRVIIEPTLRRNIHPIFDGVAFLKLYFFFRKERFHIVHTHSSKAGFLGRLAARLAGVPVIVHTIHGLPFHPFQNRWVNFLYRGLEGFAGRFTHQLITVADAMARQAVQAGVASSDKFITVRSGMDLVPFLRRDDDRGAVMKRFGLRPEDKVVGKVARLFHLKGHEYLIQAASVIVKEFPRTQFLLIGDGILRESLKKKISELGLEKNFVFGGLVPPEGIPEAISVMDIVVHVSLREGLAKVLPQAMASGKPVISFDLDGAPEVIRDGENGFLVPPCDSSALAQAILKLLRDSELCQRMGEKGRSMVDPYFRKEYMVEKIDELYKELLTVNRKL